MAYIGSLVEHSLGANGSPLIVQACSPPLTQLIERRFRVVLNKLRTAQAQLRSGGSKVRQVLRDNFLDSSKEIQQRVLTQVDEATRHADRVLAGNIVIECSEVPDCCGGNRPACIIPARGLDRIIVCIPNFRALEGGTARQEQILLHELFHRAGLQGQDMHAVEFSEIDCAQGGMEKRGARACAKAGKNLLEIVDLYVRVVWCLAALGGA